MESTPDSFPPQHPISSHTPSYSSNNNPNDMNTYTNSPYTNTNTQTHSSTQRMSQTIDPLTTLLSTLINQYISSNQPTTATFYNQLLTSHTGDIPATMELTALVQSRTKQNDNAVLGCGVKVSMCVGCVGGRGDVYWGGLYVCGEGVCVGGCVCVHTEIHNQTHKYLFQTLPTQTLPTHSLNPNPSTHPPSLPSLPHSLPRVTPEQSLSPTRTSTSKP